MQGLSFPAYRITVFHRPTLFRAWGLDSQVWGF